MFETVFIVAVCFAVLFKVVLLVLLIVVIGNVGKCNRLAAMRQAPAQASPAYGMAQWERQKQRARNTVDMEALRAQCAEMKRQAVQQAAEEYDYSVPLDVDSIPTDDPQLW